MNSKATEQYWLTQLKAGDPVAFTELYECYWEEALTAAARRTGDLDVAKDITQDVFSNIWKLRERLNISIDFSSYLFGAIKMRVLGHFQSQKIKKKVLDFAMQRMRQIEYSDDHLDTYYEMESVVSDQIDLFPETMRIAFLMRCDDQSIKEIAVTLDLAEQTVKNNISEALKRLRIALIKRYPEQSLKYLMVIASLIGDKLTNV